MTEEGRQNWLKKIAEENPEEAEFIEVKERPEEADPEPWHELYWRAWYALRNDRQFGLGQSEISYVALSRYADDNGIHGRDFQLFHILLRAMDAEYLEELERRKPPKPS